MNHYEVPIPNHEAFLLSSATLETERNSGFPRNHSIVQWDHMVSRPRRAWTEPSLEVLLSGWGRNVLHSSYTTPGFFGTFHTERNNALSHSERP